MHSSSTISVPWAQDSPSRRTTFSHRVSGFLGRRRESLASHQTPRATTTFEVPLFLSPTRYEPAGHRPGLRNSDSSMLRPGGSPSVMSASRAFHERPRSPWRPSSSQYSRSEHVPTATDVSTSVGADSHSLSAEHHPSTLLPDPKSGDRQRRHQRRRKVSTRQQIQTSRQLTFAFGITFLLAAITYLVLAITGIATGVIFHVITILLILILFGVFLHSSIRWFMLTRRRRERKQRARPKARPRRREHWFGEDVGDIERGPYENMVDEVPEKAVQIIMNEDELVDGLNTGSPDRDVQRPPPVYGNFRTSKKINPDLVHWHPVPPSPLTPTYAEAMSDVQRVVGYRPPSYVHSACGTSPIIATQWTTVDAAVSQLPPGGGSHHVM